MRSVSGRLMAQRDKLLSNAGGLLVAAGFIAAFTGGLYGLNTSDPGLVVLSVLLLMGYSVVGYLLINKGSTYFRQTIPIAGVLVFLSLLVFRKDMSGFVDPDFTFFFLYPGLALVLSYAGGALLTYALEEVGHTTAWPGKRPMSLVTVLHVAAAAPIWSAFSVLYLLGGSNSFLSTLILSASVLVSIACVAGGYASVRQGHPAITVLGGALGFAACVFYLFQFMNGGGDRDVTSFGSFISLLGLILTAFPMAIGTVAWIQLINEPPEEEAAQPTP